ncbi:tetratricopeptide repeat protein [Pigmentibacter sp. JX0631]|uniref:tetratricopeptide repeat protein n=1 Tax=Pigmentibacter sp. JX0631 TaxID=2976982 RepID=UPI0024686F50|nr:tetratricopeptide repeat protein [Pigmentibacter sp. JX0631]WGL58579.1 tetratricopeptide repeat protein [Pigmentibacter sp. JX0631]
MRVKTFFLASIFFLITACETPKNNEIIVDSKLLNLPNYQTFFYYPESTTKEQRLSASKKYIPNEVIDYLKSNKESSFLDIVSSNPILNKTIPSTLDVIASSIADIKRGDYQKAIEKNKNILNILERQRTKTLDEDYAVSPFREAMLILALAYMQAGEEKQTLQILEKLIISSNHWTPAYLALGEFYFSKKANKLALDVAVKGIDKCSNDLLYLYILQLKSEREMGNLISAKQIVNRLNTLYPKDSNVLLWQGILYQDDKDYLAACNSFRKAFEENRTNPYISHNHAYCLIQSGQYDEANEILMLAMTNHPSVPFLYYLNGFLENKRKNYLSAYKSWEAYLSMISENDPNYRIVNFKLTQMENENLLDSYPEFSGLPVTSN